MINLNTKVKTAILAILLFLITTASYQTGKARAQKDLVKARTDLAELKAEYARNEAATAAAYAAALKKASDAAIVQQNKTDNISRQLVAANTRTKKNANKIKEVIAHETDNTCAVLDADSVQIYNAALGY